MSSVYITDQCTYNHSSHTMNALSIALTLSGAGILFVLLAIVSLTPGTVPGIYDRMNE